MECVLLGVLNRKYPPLEHAGDFAEDGERVGQVFEDVVGEDPIKGGACCFARLPPLLWGRAGVGGCER